jgi:hypothetical protein|tara:strand:+ start:73569 stop:73745 length:177 start_codon:yes stop_codon:yes gene_type:complete
LPQFFSQFNDFHIDFIGFASRRLSVCPGGGFGQFFEFNPSFVAFFLKTIDLLLFMIAC